MKKLKFMLAAATALGFAAVSQAEDFPGSTDFESISLTDSLFQFTGSEGDNESEIVTGSTVYSGNRPRKYANSGTSEKYLKVSTGTDPLLRKLNNSAQDVAEKGNIYIDTLVQFTVTPATEDVTANANDKLLIYLKEDGNGATNLMVMAALHTPGEGDFGGEGGEDTFDATNVVVSSNVAAGEWYRLTVKSNVKSGILYFNIWLDGQLLHSSELNGGTISLFDDGSDDTLKNFPSLLGKTSTTLAAVGFAGEGCVDDLAMTTADPFVQAIDFTLTLGTGVSGVSFTIGSNEYTLSATTATSATYPVYPGDTITMGTPVYADDYMAGSATDTAVNLTLTEGVYTVDDAASCSLTLANGVGVAAKIGDTKYADLATALSEATAGQTVTLAQDATVTSASTAAGTLDLNGKTLTLSGTTDLTFTGTGAATLKGGDLMGVYNELTITAPAGADLTFDGMTFHASVTPAGSGDLFTATNCQFLCDIDKTGAAFTDGSTADVHSYGVLFKGTSLFAQADIVNSTFDQGRRAAVQASFAGDLYFYGNTVVADKLTSRIDGAATRYPALQIFSNGRVFIENNTFSGQYLGEPFCIYNKGTYRASDKAVVFNGNTVANGVEHLWGVYDVDASGSDPVADANVLFGANTVGDQVDLSKCVYKTTLDDAPYGPTPASLALPTGVATVYAWTHAAGATDYYVNGTAAADLTTVAANDTVIAVPGATVTEPAAVILTADATLKNQFTAGAAVAQITGGAKYATLQAAVDAASAGDTVTVLADCTISTSLSIAKNITVHNDHTITGAVNYAICIGAAVTFEGSGKIERASGITGSAFCVGANETTRGAITAGTAGTLNFDGLTVCGGSGGNLIKLENGTVNMNGGVLKDGLRGIKADADAGNYTSAIVINGGTITNCSGCAVMASAASANGTATVVVNGGEIAGSLVYDGTAGTHSITIPGTSTAKFNADQSAFCEAGYETTLVDGWYVVTAVQQAGWVDDSSTVSNQTAGAAYSALAGTALADADAQKLTDWAKANSVAFNDATTSAASYVDAFMLNCAPTAEAVAAAEEAFKLGITFDANGTPVVTVPTGYNVTPQLKGSNDLTTWTDVEAASTSYKFYKCELSL